MKVVKVLGFSAREKQLAIKTENFSLTVKDGRDLVREQRVNTEELLLARLAGSIHAVGSLIGNTLDIELKGIQIEVRGVLKEGEVNNVSVENFKKIDIIVKPTSDASIIILKEWIDAVKVACPVFSDFKLVTPTVLTLVKEYDKTVAA